MSRYATNIEHNGGCPDCDAYESKIDRMNAKIASLESQLAEKQSDLDKLISGNAELRSELSEAKKEVERLKIDSSEAGFIEGYNCAQEKAAKEFVDLRRQLDEDHEAPISEKDEWLTCWKKSHGEAVKLITDQKIQIESKDKEIDNLKIDASNHAYQSDIAKRERDNAEKEDQELREALKELFPHAQNSGHGISEELEMKCRKLIGE